MPFFRFFAERPMLANVITLLIILLGLASLNTIKRDAFPSVEFGELLISTTYPGASPEDVELMVTNNIEEELKKVTGLKRFISWSRENVSLIHVVVDPNVKDEDKVIREIREAVSRVTGLPAEVTEPPLVTELSTASFPMIEIGFAGDDIAYNELRNITRNFERKLERLEGVSSVARYGYQDREIQIEIDPDALIKNDIALGEVVRAIGLRNIRSTGGSFESYTSEKNIVTLAQFRAPDDVKNVIVRTTFDGPAIQIKDIANINDGFKEEKVLSRVNRQKAISLVAFKSETADMIRTVEEIREIIEKEKALLPEQVSILISNDESQYVKDRLSIVATNGLLGLSFVLVVLAIFLSFRIAFWVALGIPVTLLGTLFLLPLFDSFLDSITMTAMVLVIGIVVDDAIIIAESIYQHYEKGKSAVEAAVAGIQDVIRPVVTTILTTLTVFMPIFFMPGMLGKFAYVIPLVVSLALLISLLESTLALPAHISHGLKRSKPSQENHSFFLKLKQMYQAFLFKALRARYLFSFLFFGMLGASILYATKYMDFILFPSSTAERFMVLIETPTGTSLQATSDKTSEIETIISKLSDKELDSYVTRIGTFGDIGSSELENNAVIQVSLTPFADRERTANDIVEHLREQTKALAAVRIIYYVDNGGPPVGRPITLRVVGVDDEKRTALTDEIYQFIETIPGTKDLDRDDKAGKSQVEIKFDFNRLARVGISVADVARNVRIAYDGEVVTSVRYGDEDVDFRVIFSTKVRKDPASLAQLMLPNRNNYLTPLNEVAEFVSAPGPANFTHFDGDRAITITGDVDTDQITALEVSKQIQAAFNIEQDYPGMELLVGGEAEESQSSIDELVIIMGISCIGIYLLLTLLFNSLWQPIVVMMAIPFGMLGVVIGFSIHDQALGFLGLIGIIGLAGVVVNDSLVLVAHINDLRKKVIPNTQESLRAIVAEATSNRLRAVLLTTISTVVGLLPLAYGLGGSDPYMGPMALALGWGLMFATPLTLLLIPSIYLIGEDVIKLSNKCLRR